MRADHENGKAFYYEGGADGVLLLHGFTATPGTLRPQGEMLRREGYTVSCPMLPGHGTTIGDMLGKSWADWLACAREEYSRLSRKCSRVAVCGLSMGGALAAILAEEYRPAGCVFYSPCIRMKQKYACIAKAAGLFIKVAPGKPAPQDDPYDELGEYNCAYEGTPVSKGYDLWRLTVRARLGMKKIVSPVLILQSELDTTIDRTGARLLYDSVSSEDKKLILLKESRHVCTLGPEREKVNEETSAFLRRIFG